MLGLLACEDPQKIGSDLLPAGSQAGVFFSDTFTVRASTVLLDSVLTSGSGLLLGRYADPTLGPVEARSFLQLAPNQGDTLKYDASKAVYDSLVLLLPYSGYSYGDTTRYQNIAVHRLLDTLSNARTYLNTDQVPYEATPLGRASYKPNFDVNSSPVLRLKLSDAFGRELFALAGKPQSTDAVAFRNYLKGLALIPGAGDQGSVVSLSSGNAGLGIYYHVDTVTYAYVAYARPGITKSGLVAAPTARFVNIKTQRSGALTALTRPGQAVASSRTNYEVYLQEGSNLAVKLEFPTLNQLRNLPQGKVALNQAELLVGTKAYPINLNPPGSLSLAESDATNKPLRTPQNQIRYVLQEASASSPEVVGYDPDNERYLFNVTTQLQQMLTGQRAATGLLLLRQPPQVQTSQGTSYLVTFLQGGDVSRAVFDARQIRLKVYYTISNN